MLSRKGEGDDNNLRFGHNLCVLSEQVAGGSTPKIDHCSCSWSPEPWAPCLCPERVS